MTTEQVKARIAEIAREKFGTGLGPDGFVIVGPGSPSLEVLDFALGLEEKFGVRFDLSEMSDPEFLRADQLAALITKKLSAP